MLRTEMPFQFNAFIYPSTSTLLHPPPILEGGIYQCIRRNGRNGIVPILNFDGIEGDFLNDAIGRSVSQLNPVADAKHIVGRKLYTRYKSKNSVLEY